MANPSPQTKGGKPDKIIRDALMAAARQSPYKLKLGAELLIQQFSEGNLEVAKFVADRIDGKAMQPLSHNFSQETQTDESLDAQLAQLARKAGIAIIASSQASPGDVAELPSVH